MPPLSSRFDRAEVVVLSVRERDYARGFAWDVVPGGEVAEVVSRQRVGVPARGIIRTARVGRVADEIVYVAHKHHADEIVVGRSAYSWLGRLLYSSVSPPALRSTAPPKR